MSKLSAGDITRRNFARLLALAPLATSAPRIERPALASVRRESNDDLRTRLPVLMEYLVEAVPGCSVATIVEGRLAWTEGVGFRKAGTTDPVTPETVFEAASLSKPVFGYAVLRLCDEGRFDLDRPLLDYMPFPDIDDTAQARLVTARHVLSHRTGLPNWRSSPALTFAAAPGSRFGYSGEGVVWLQRVIEHVTTIPFAQYLRERVFDPLGMSRSSFLLRRDQLDNYSLSHPTRGQSREGIYFDQGLRYLELAERWGKPLETWKYEDAIRATRELDPKAPANPSPTGWSPNAAGGMLTTAADYARFMLRSMPRSRRDGADLSVRRQREMLTPATRVNRGVSYGLGWGLEEVDGTRSFHHGGWNRGFKSFALGDVEGRCGIVLLTNSTEGDRLFWPVVHGFTGRGEAALLS